MTQKYVVQNGDTIESIAKVFNVKEKDIIELNNLTRSFFLMPGQEILIPVEPPKGLMFYEVKQGDTLFGIARQYETSADFLSEINGMDMGDIIYPGENILVPDPEYLSYITEEGDTLKFVADAFGTNTQQIVKENDEIFLLPGQLIVYKKKQN